MLLETLGAPFTSIRAANSTDASYPTRVPTNSRPNLNDGVVDLRPDGQFVQNVIILVPYGTQSNDNTFLMRVIGWRRIGVPGSPNVLWVPVPLVELSLTVGNITGVAGTPLPANQLFVDTITSTLGNAGVDVDIISPANDTIAHAVVDIKGFHMVEVIFNLNSGGGTDMNCLYALA